MVSPVKKMEAGVISRRQMTEPGENADWLDKRRRSVVLPGTDRADDERLELDQWKMLLYGPEKRTYAGGLCDAGRLHCG